MNKVVKYDGNQIHPEGMESGIDLGRKMGHRQAFAVIAGRCSAADVEVLRRIRQEKSYRELGCTWAEFCTLHLHVARRSVDRAIGHLEEFGPAFFHITQLAHITPKEYRSIGACINAQGVNVDGNVVALLPENSQQLSTAIAELLKRIESTEQAPPSPGFDAALKRCQSIAEALLALPPGLDPKQKIELAYAVAQIRKAAAGLGVLIVS